MLRDWCSVQQPFSSVLLTVKTEVSLLKWLNSTFFLGYIHQLGILMDAKLIKYNTDFSFLLAIFIN